MTLSTFNGKEVGFFKSAYNETIMIDFENIFTDNGNGYSATKDPKTDEYNYVKASNKDTTVLFNGQLIKCAIALIIEDKNLLNYIKERGFMK